MKRTKIAMIIAVVLSVMLFTSCQKLTQQEPASSVNSNESVVDTLSLEQAKELLQEMLPKAIKVCNVYLNCDVQIEPTQDGEYPKDGYFKVTDGRFSDIEELKAYTETVFTKEFAQTYFYQYGIDGTKEVEPTFVMRGNQLWVRDGATGMAMEWLVDTAEIKKQTDNSIVLSVEKTYFEESDGFHDIVLEKVQDQWRIASDLL